MEAVNEAYRWVKKQNRLLKEVLKEKEQTVTDSKNLSALAAALAVAEPVIQEDVSEQIVWGFYENEMPLYTQGKAGAHELTSPITAKEANGLVATIAALRADNARLREALEQAAIWHEAAGKALSKQPPGGDRGWRRLEHKEQRDALRAALEPKP